jgi:hypothetical protein
MGSLLMKMKAFYESEFHSVLTLLVGQETFAMFSHCEN